MLFLFVGTGRAAQQLLNLLKRACMSQVSTKSKCHATLPPWLVVMFFWREVEAQGSYTLDVHFHCFAMGFPDAPSKKSWPSRLWSCPSPSARCSSISWWWPGCDHHTGPSRTSQPIQLLQGLCLLLLQAVGGDPRAVEPTHLQVPPLLLHHSPVLHRIPHQKCPTMTSRPPAATSTIEEAAPPHLPPTWQGLRSSDWSRPDRAGWGRSPPGCEAFQDHPTEQVHGESQSGCDESAIQLDHPLVVEESYHLGLFHAAAFPYLCQIPCSCCLVLAISHGPHPPHWPPP